MISFVAYHGNADLRRKVIDDIARHIVNGDLDSSYDETNDRLGLISAIADGPYDLSIAHNNSGFPAPLLLAAEAIFVGLSDEHAPVFALELMKAARIDTNLANVGWTFVEWMFADAVARLGNSRVRTAVKEAGPIFKTLADAGTQNPAQQKADKALAKKLRRRGLETPSADEALVAKAVAVLLDSGAQHIGSAIHWIAQLHEQPSTQYRLYAWQLIFMVETAE